MSVSSRKELEQILGAIREVEVNLDRRDARAYGAVLAMWAVVGASVFGIYHWMVTDPHHDPGPYAWVHIWFWVLPVGVAFVVSALVGARRWRLEAGTRRDARLWGFLAAIVPPIAVSAVFVHTDLPYAPALWIAFLGAFLVLPGWRDAGPLRAMRLATAAALLATAALVLAAQPIWSNLAAAIAFAVGLGGFGMAKYARGE